jgi:hypothetical protein
MVWVAAPMFGGDSLAVRLPVQIKQMKRFLMDLSVNCYGRSANLSLVESHVSWLERRHLTAVLRREHASPNKFTEIYCVGTTIAIEPTCDLGRKCS